ncbi:3-hydroxyacyl-CoA dehydrogenase/enoyl-CoA hydratase family protein [Suttonella sp. R2A3]|uniref:3-hydroxyacyl-CoA dehydrogenase/enoyl-CoA hydratase family protein n=1 Tax=Suttonella sp. R2A3 TaxID=2908648 RepID=UPI001F28CC23|nr:3-hydroxyacyl-CoA dehydrogenase/enoyl-CoA hydratase family protein [Suttonella sp. R2A3]UJF24335.1 3-hydroxyacyl-CoA dehydrogenase/enoyl-CoA hydratase family protein [Suttonella sp. R2A3]
MSHKPIRTVAVLGAGVMGAQIAAHFANAHYPVKLFDLVAKEGDDRNAIVNKALKRLSKLKPAPFAEAGVEGLITACNYEDDLEQLKDCDLVIEAIAEKLEWKRDLYERIAPALRDDAILATNTSGLSIQELAEAVPKSARPRFCGVHFFNPPRYMHLVELIPCKGTQAEVLDRLETFLVSRLGKGVVRARNTPNFIANRVGVFAMLAAVKHAQAFGLGFDVVDQLTGRLLGRPKSATFRTADVVGLDTMAHVVNTKKERLQDDPWHAHYVMPDYLQKLIDNGALGQKSGAGFYKKEGKKISQFNPESGEYVPADGKADADVVAILKNKDAGARLAALRASDHPQAQFIWACLRDTFHYAAYHLADIAHCARDIDLALRWGFGWDEGPFETWQKAGWSQVASWISEDIADGKALADAALPAWVEKIDGVHSPKGSYDAANDRFLPRSDLPVYARQIVPALVYGEAQGGLGHTVTETDTLRTFTLDHAAAEGLLVASFKTKMRTCSHTLLKDLMAAIDLAEAEYDGLVIWQGAEGPFSAGADLASVQEDVLSGNLSAATQFAKDFQRTSMRIRNSGVPVVAAAQGLALGGGCEFLMHSDRVVAALESYIGLVEVGVGLLPGGAGTKEFAMRAAKHAHGNYAAALRDRFMTIATAKVSTSAVNAQELGYLKDSDVVVFNGYELLYVALKQAGALASAYRPPVSKPFKVGGRSTAATFKGQLTNMLAGHMISEYDYEIASTIAGIMTGGDVDEGTKVNEDWLLRIEHEGFMKLVANSKTHERIQHMLKTGKPLRN